MPKSTGRSKPKFRNIILVMIAGLVYFLIRLGLRSFGRIDSALSTPLEGFQPLRIHNFSDSALLDDRISTPKIINHAQLLPDICSSDKLNSSIGPNEPAEIKSYKPPRSFFRQLHDFALGTLADHKAIIVSPSTPFICMEVLNKTNCKTRDYSMRLINNGQNNSILFKLNGRFWLNDCDLYVSVGVRSGRTILSLKITGSMAVTINLLIVLPLALGLGYKHIYEAIKTGCNRDVRIGHFVLMRDRFLDYVCEQIYYFFVKESKHHSRFYYDHYSLLRLENKIFMDAAQKQEFFDNLTSKRDFLQVGSVFLLSFVLTIMDLYKATHASNQPSFALINNLPMMISLLPLACLLHKHIDVKKKIKSYLPDGLIYDTLQVKLMEKIKRHISAEALAEIESLHAIETGDVKNAAPIMAERADSRDYKGNENKSRSRVPVASSLTLGFASPAPREQTGTPATNIAELVNSTADDITNPLLTSSI